MTGDDTIVDLDAFRHAASGRTDGDLRGTTSTAAYHDRALVAGLKVAFENLDTIPVENITYEVDYPHSDSTWPNSLAIAERHMAKLTQ